jgi:hypothetical protein
MKLTVQATTGAKILVWKNGDLVHARSESAGHAAQVCLAVDLFEVIAELAGLDLDNRTQAAEAIQLADEALKSLNDDVA